MSKAVCFLSFVAVLAAGPILGGCSSESDSSIMLSYERPAKFPVSERIRRIAVADFSGASETDLRWGSIAADKLSDELGRSGREFHRFELVDRRNLAKIMREQDIKLMTSDQQAVQVGKLANVQAMIYGNIRVNSKDERASRQQIVPSLSKGVETKTVYYTKRFVLVSVNLTMTDIDTGRVVHPFTKTREFDSDKASSSMLRTFGFGSDAPPPVDQTVNQVMDQVVQEFAQEISPHRLEIEVKLEKGKTKSVESGNVLAKTKDYAEALAKYKAGLAEKPDDDGAAFNAGVMHEALGEFVKAEQFYGKAFDISNKARYAEARQRVRVEGAKSTPGGAGGAPVQVKTTVPSETP